MSKLMNVKLMSEKIDDPPSPTLILNHKQRLLNIDNSLDYTTYPKRSPPKRVFPECGDTFFVVIF